MLGGQQGADLGQPGVHERLAVAGVTGLGAQQRDALQPEQERQGMLIRHADRR
jgi:hypothetical protein